MIFLLSLHLSISKVKITNSGHGLLDIFLFCPLPRNVLELKLGLGLCCFRWKGKRAGEDTLNFGMMDASELPSSVSAPQEASHYDELSIKQSLNFSDSLKMIKFLMI